jgi:hypothetical protein
MTHQTIPTRLLAAVGAPAGSVPSLFLYSEDRGKRFWEFFTANIRNKKPGRPTSSPSRGFRIGASCGS